MINLLLIIHSIKFRIQEQDFNFQQFQLNNYLVNNCRIQEDPKVDLQVHSLHLRADYHRILHKIVAQTHPINELKLNKLDF